MSNRKWIIFGLQSLLLSLTVLIVLAFIYPIVNYLSSPESKVHSLVLQSNTNQSASYEWLAKHYKWQDTSKNETPQLLLIDDPAMLDADINRLIDHNYLIGEYLGASETVTPSQKSQTEFLFGISYSGFIGKVCSDLANPAEVSSKVRNLYEKNNQTLWNFSGKGLIIFSNTQVYVLKEGIDYEGDVFWTDHQLKEVFKGYFEIITTTEQVTSEFLVSMTKTGIKKLDHIGLKPYFPASIEKGQSLYQAFYFTTAFKDMSISAPYFLKNVESLMANKILYDRTRNDKIYWKWYAPLVKKISSAAQNPYVYNPIASTKPNQSPLFKVEGQQILKQNATGAYAPFYMKGVNLGAALPGKTFTEFPQETELYMKWLHQMGSLHINTLRIYTLLPPNFYKALYDYNQTAAEPIYLLQEIWPEENPPGHNYLAEAYNNTYHQEIDYVIHAVHGNINVPKRSYRAYGAYAYDVSDYLIGYLVGRELEPDEVLTTDRLNPNYQFKGTYLFGEDQSSPTENWLAAACDYALQTETQGYGAGSLVSIVNWPTLDPLDHSSEWNLKGDKSLQFNDKAVVDINNIGIHKDKAPGLFGSYHIYPNYPDFMNNDFEYNAYSDAQGRFRYGGYLKAFMAQHTKYPAVVAEYGISTSMFTAHVAPDGNNHGGISEQEQGKQIIRMTNAIQKEGYSGGLIFEWIDEWAKKTWTTEPYMIPYNRHSLWHNAIDPEQNYGLIAFKSAKPAVSSVYRSEISPIRQVKVSGDAAFIQLTMTFESEAAAQKSAQLLIDTHNPAGSEPIPEYLLTLDKQSELLVNPGYNWLKNRYLSKKIPLNQYEALMLQTNPEGLLKDGSKIPSIFITMSQLSTGSFDTSQNQIQRNGATVSIRLPYTLLGISDPSSAQVLSDSRTDAALGIDQIKTQSAKEIQFTLKQEGQADIVFGYTMTVWDEVDFFSRPKAGFNDLSLYFKNLGN